MQPWVVEGAELPDPLREPWIEPPVTRLWVLGLDLAFCEPRVAIVGSRAATPYGIEMARAIAADLAAAGITIVSGMARGIDSAAHLGALDAGGKSVAVLAGGVDRPYPASSRAIYARILDGAGAIVSEVPPGSDHRAERFLERNRIIAALSLGVVLVQADGRRSGALRTTSCAREYGRELFAVPGDARSLLSAGPHDLIRKSGARICTGAEDVVAGLEQHLKGRLLTLMDEPPGLDADELAAIKAVNSKPGRADELARRASLEIVPAMRALSRLELGGFVRRENGIYYRPR